ncbi:coiled-coil domain-containing protein 107 isoform X2 [Rhinoderma darwinii]|uniref:coiled-coil domain-containing protein 107 isoform X2 n=1 Tax=Rhinoderma darwinii TaxID=43563 RepID=UPI003F6816AB
MVLSSSQQLLLALSLALCACFLLPKMFGGGVRDTGKKDPRRMPPPMHGGSPRESKGNPHSHRGTLGKSNHHDQIKDEMEKQLNAEKTGRGHSMAFTLMPMYAVGVALFAAYKFSKMKSDEKSKSKSSKEDEKKTKETESQLLQLEKHLSQTEQMLNSLLTQLNPLSNCVNSLASEQKDEIMNQLQSIRQLMKKSGMIKSPLSNSAKESCEDTLEDLIHSFKIQNPDLFEKDEEKESEVSILDGEDLDLPVEEPGVSHCKEDRSQPDEQDVTPRHTSDGLRKRNVKD